LGLLALGGVLLMRKRVKVQSDVGGDVANDGTAFSPARSAK
jgi:hypothetical protein